MRFGILTSIGHNIADSFASGIGLMIGVYEMDVFGEARKTPEGFIGVDFLTGDAFGGKPSPELSRALKFYAEALPALCERHGVEASDFEQLSAKFFGRVMFEGFSVTVKDRHGRCSTDDYLGVPGTRVKKLDHLGRVRRT